MNLLKVDQWLARLLPRVCGLCGMPSGSANTCAGCLSDLPWIARPCLRCGAPLPDGVGGALCGVCDIDTGRLSGLRAALVYGYPVDRVVARAKFRRRADCARLLGEWLAETLTDDQLHRADVVVPVPLHARRLAVRGFNQAVEIARAVCERHALRMMSNACRRLVNTAPQSDLPAGARRRNVRGAFSASSLLAGRDVVLVDDVVTTGSTLVALADAVLEEGAGSVHAWVAARTHQATRNV